MNQQHRALFEAFYRRHSTSAQFLIEDALLLGADGEYFNVLTRDKFAYFCAGIEAQLLDSSCFKSWDNGPLLVEQEEEFPDLPAPAEPDPKAPGPWIDQNCNGCHGKGNGKGDECPRCWEIPF